MDMITLYEDAAFTQPIQVQVTTLAAVGDWSSGTNTRTVVGSGDDAITFYSCGGNPNFGTPFSMVEDPEPLVENRPASGDTPAITPDWRDKILYIKPNMQLKINFYVDSSNRLHTGVLASCAGVTIGSTYLSQTESASNIRKLCFGVLKRQTVDSVCMYIRTSNTSCRCVWISPNFWDGTASVHTPSKTRNVTPNGYGGARGQRNEGRNPQNMFNSINVLSQSIGGRGVHVYELQSGQLAELYSRLWSINPLIKLENALLKPTAGLLSAHMLPISPSKIATGHNGINLCGVRYDVGSATYLVDEQMYSTDLFVRDLPAASGFTESYLDYSPYITAQLELPFCGIVPIDINKIMDGSLGVRYIIDILTGNCMAEVYFKDRNDPDNWQLYSRYTGNCAYHLPITADESGGTQMLGIFSGLATVGMGAAVGNPAIAAGGASKIMGASGIPNDVGMIGTFSQNVACLAGDLFIRLHLTCKDDLTIMHDSDDMLQQICGLPAGVSGLISEFSGFLQGVIHEEDIKAAVGTGKATEAELSEIVSAFGEGVFV